METIPEKDEVGAEGDARCSGGAGGGGGGGGGGVGGGGGEDDEDTPVLLLDTRKRALDQTCSSLSSHQSGGVGPRESTPLNSQQLFDSAEFFNDNDDIAEQEIAATEPPVKVTKLTKEDAYKLLKTVNSAADAALEAVKTLVGGKYDDLTDDDVQTVDKITEKIRMRFVHLQKAVKSRKLVMGSDKASATFVKVEDFDGLDDICNSEEHFRDSESEVDDPSIILEGKKTQGMPKYRKPLDKLSEPKTRASRTKVEFEAFKDFCTANQITVAQGAGYFIQRYYYNSNKILAKLGNELFKGEADIKVVPELSVELGFHFVERFRMSRQKYTNLRILLLPYVIFPPYNKISDLRLFICPQITAYPTQEGLSKCGVVADLGDCLRKNVSRKIQFAPSFIPPCNCVIFCQCKNLAVKVVGCADGRGDEKQWAQKSQVHLDTSHAFSLLYNIPSIHELEPEKDLSPTITDEEVESSAYLQESIPNYDPSDVPASHKKFDLDMSLRSDSRVWGLKFENLEAEFSSVRNDEGTSLGRELVADRDVQVEAAVVNVEGDISVEGFDDQVGSVPGAAVVLALEDCDVDTIVGQADLVTPDATSNQAEGDDDSVDTQAINFVVDVAKISKPLDFQVLGKPVFEDKEPNSHRAQRPWGVIHMRETTENVRELMRTVIEPQVVDLKEFLQSIKKENSLDFRTEYLTVKKSSDDKLTVDVVKREDGAGGVRKVEFEITERKVRDLRKPFLLVAQEGGCITALSVDFQLKAMDSKLIEIMNERTGAYCYCCTMSRDEAHKIDVVKKGFHMDFSMERLWDTFEKIANDMGVDREDWDTLEIPSKPGDEDVRFGLKRAPLTRDIEVTKIVAVLHITKLRKFGWLEQLLLKLASNVKQWKAGKRLGERQKERFLACKEEWKGEVLGELVGYRHLSAPNQITGHLVDLIFSETNREKVIQGMAKLRSWKKSYGREMLEDEKENFRTLLQMLSVIGRVTSSSRLIKVYAFRKYCLACYEFILDKWSWCQVSESVHRLLAHTWEMIILNKNHGLMNESEQGSECSHKEERHAREFQSRKCDLVSGDTDTFRHKWGATDDGVRSFDRRPWCSFCSTDKHWTHGCKARMFGPHGLEDDAIVQSFMCDELEEPEDQKNLLDKLSDIWGI